MPQSRNASGNVPAQPIEVLKEDMFGLYYGAGRNVTYVADSGEVRPYWANRFLQTFKHAVDVGDAEVVAYATRMVTSDEPSRGFGYLEAAGRLDLTVEALVADTSKPYHHLFDDETVQAAVDRLTAYGHTINNGKPVANSDRLAAEAIIGTENGVAVELTVEVTREGAVNLRAGEHTERASGTLDAVRKFVGLLAQAEAAAAASAS